MQQIIAKRRDRGIHTPEEFAFLAEGAGSHTVPDYQLSAWLMAAFLNPLSLEETAQFTTAMAASGERLDLTGLPKPWVDKHSTGGVGDKTTLVVLPMLAACGLTCIKMSGRGLGITGGTVDKLSSIPGFRLDLSPAEMKQQAARIGLALTGQTPNLAPADKTLYSIRDSTETVASVPLIVASILSKKLAGGAETIMLDVKSGSGGFMPDFESAKELASWLCRVGTLCGLTVHAAISDMDQPLGRAAGNALEVTEAIEVLSGLKGRFADLCVDLVGLTLAACGIQGGQELAQHALDSGGALQRFQRWIQEQGGDLDKALPRAKCIQEFNSEYSGWVLEVDARQVGQVVVDLGGGRREKDDAIDLSVGVETLVEVGSKIEIGQPIFRVHAASDTGLAIAAAALKTAVEFSQERVAGRRALLTSFS